MLQVYEVGGLLTKIELGCLNDAAEKFFATQCNNEEANVCLWHIQFLTLPILGGKTVSSQADFKVWCEAALGVPGLSR